MRAYPLYDRSGVDEEVAPILTLQRIVTEEPPQAIAEEPAAADLPRSLRCRAAIMLGILVVANAVMLGTLGVVAASYPAFLSLGILAFSFGLRHAVDADHIAAIDNVSRKLIADQRPSLGVGLYFSLGHSSVVFFLCIGVAAGSAFLQHHTDKLQQVGTVIGTGVSAFVLSLVAIINLFIARGLYRDWRELRAPPVDFVEEVHENHDGGGGLHSHIIAVRRGAACSGPGTCSASCQPAPACSPSVVLSVVSRASNPARAQVDSEARISGPGFLSRCCPRIFSVVDRAWKMYFVGLLFGLGFDTASEVALLALTAMGAKNGLPPEVILLLPLLFAAGMALIDTADGMLMLWAYQVGPLHGRYVRYE